MPGPRVYSPSPVCRQPSSSRGPSFHTHPVPVITGPLGPRWGLGQKGGLQGWDRPRSDGFSPSSPRGEQELPTAPPRAWLRGLDAPPGQHPTPRHFESGRGRVTPPGSPRPRDCPGCERKGRPRDSASCFHRPSSVWAPFTLHRPAGRVETGPTSLATPWLGDEGRLLGAWPKGGQP